MKALEGGCSTESLFSCILVSLKYNTKSQNIALEVAGKQTDRPRDTLFSEVSEIDRLEKDVLQVSTSI